MNHFTEDSAKDFVVNHIAGDEQGFSELVSVKYIQTVAGICDTCNGCTLGDGQDCSLPTHYVDEFLVVCKKRTDSPMKNSDFVRYSLLSMGWAEGSCSNSFGDYNEVLHFKYFENEPYRRVAFASYEELLAHAKKRAQ